MILDCIYRYLPPPLRFLYSLCFWENYYTPYYSDSRHLKAASKKLCNRLMDLQKEHCPLVSFDFGVVTTKLAIFVPHGVRFCVKQKYQNFVLLFLSYSASALNGRFLFLRFHRDDFYLLVDFLNEHNFPFTTQKVLNCAGSAALATAPLLIERTGFTEFRKFNRHNCQREGLIFNHSLKLKQQFFHCARPDYTPEPQEALASPEGQQIHLKWRAQHHFRRVSVKQPPQFPCLFVDIGNTLKVYRFSPEAYEILGEYYMGGGTFLGVAHLFLLKKGLRMSYNELMRFTSRGNPLNVDMTVGDIYGGAYAGENLDTNLLAACFGKYVDLQQNKAKKHIARARCDGGESGSEEAVDAEPLATLDCEACDSYNSASPQDVAFELPDMLSALQRMIAINAAHIAARHAALTGIRQCVFSGGFLDDRSVMENVAWAFHLYSGQEAIFIQHDIVLCALGALFGDQREYLLDDKDDVVKMVEMIENDPEISIDVPDQ